MKIKQGESERKVRSDRKRDIKPVIPIDLYDCISRISYVTDTRIKQVAETLLINGLSDKKILDDLSVLFRRDFKYENEYGDPILYHGDANRIPVKVDRGEGHRARLSMRFHQSVHDMVSSLAFALDLTVSSAASLLIRYAFIHGLGLAYIERHIEENLDETRLKQLREILAFMNQFNHDENRMTIPKLMAYLADQIYSQTKPIKTVLYEFIQRYFA